MAATLPPSRSKSPRWLVPVLGAAALVSIGAAAGAFWPRHVAAATAPSFQRLTFRRGTIQTARFAPDGKTVIYGAAWDGNLPETYLVTRDSPESRALGVPRSDIFAVSATGELALALRKGYPFPPVGATLARAPMFGGAAPREAKDKVEFADWGPDSSLAVTLDTGIGDRLEYPIGKPVFETPGPIHYIRVSPDGTGVAFQHFEKGEAVLALADRAGTHRTLSAGWRAINGIAWAPSGKEVWFSALDKNGEWGLEAVTLDGAVRLLLRVPGILALHDLARDGRALISREITESGIRLAHAGAAREQDVSWLDGSTLADVSRDGQVLLFSEFGAAGGPDGSVYLRKTDGSPAVRLGDGGALRLSPDGAWALSLSRRNTGLKLLPTGAGEPRSVPGSFERYWGDADWLPDGKRIVFVANEAKHDPRVWIQDLAGTPTPISPEGLVGAVVVSPDGHRVATNINGAALLLDIDVRGAAPLPGVERGEAPVAWSVDGSSIFVATREMASVVTRVDVATGRRTPWKVLQPADSAGVVEISAVHVGDDGKAYAYSYTRTLSELYLVEGLK